MVKDKTLAENFLKREGRLNRWRYFKRTVILALVTALVEVPIISIFADANGNMPIFGNILMFIVTVIFLYPEYCLIIRRLHDFDRDELLAKVYIAGVIASYFFTFIFQMDFMALAIVLAIMALYFLLVPGTRGSNKYGADPLNQI